jgi:hypothetical protein
MKKFLDAAWIFAVLLVIPFVAGALFAHFLLCYRWWPVYILDLAALTVVSWFNGYIVAPFLLKGFCRRWE